MKIIFILKISRLIIIMERKIVHLIDQLKIDLDKFLFITQIYHYSFS